MSPTSSSGGVEDAARPVAVAAAGRVLGVDPGTVRVGLAISDAGRRLASPLRTVARTSGLVALLARVAREEEAVGIVVGLPLSLDGSVGPAARAALADAELLRAATGLAVECYDERFTTVVATRSRQGRGKRSRAGVDERAATVMLQGWLDRHGAAR